jgi:P-type Cu+ transporter
MKETNTVLDPVCGMTIDPQDSVGSLEFEGRTYHFCAASCQQAFGASPTEFVRNEPAPSCCGPACCSA